MDHFTELKQRLSEISRLREVASLLGWDQQTYMPSGAATSRAEQSAALNQHIHQLFISDEIGKRLEIVEKEFQGKDPESDEVRMIALLRHEYDRAVKLPSTLVAEMARHVALSQEVWIRARAQSDFASFAPFLEKMIDLCRQQAGHWGYQDHLYNALLEEYEPGARYQDIATMFDEIKPHLITLTKEITQSKRASSAELPHGHFPIEKQRELTLRVIQKIGYDLKRGRQDESAHPFCSSLSRNDVRITTHFSPQTILQGLYSSLHETGHALYEQGIPSRLDGTILAGGISLGVHESQSRLWENLVGRSRAFCVYIFPELQKFFPESFNHLDIDAYYQAINKVAPSLIRIEADEVTYNLHVLLRFELESGLLKGSLTVRDLPAAWNEKMQNYLGIQPPDDARGVLQDVHWSLGLIGYFPTYTLGNLISAQLWHIAKKEILNLEEQISSGNFASLLNWLRNKIHSHGRKFWSPYLIQKATGQPLSSSYYVDYLSTKYRALYEIH